MANRSPEVVASWIIGEVFGQLRVHKMTMDQFPVKHCALGELIDLVENGKLSRLRGKNILAEMISCSTKSPLEIANEFGWLQINDHTLTETFCKQVLEENTQIVENYKRAGNDFKKEKCIKALIGKAMMVSKGQLDPKLVTHILRKYLE